MQIDMHYYATYAMARAAGIKADDAHIIAYSAQYVDDSTKNNSKDHKDGGMVYCIATSHHGIAVIKNRIHKLEEQRRVWIPFHFYPGNIGDNLSKKLICQKNSKLVREMFDNHIEKAVSSNHGLHLIGIASHVFEDTFAHYGFSGVSSRNNKVDGGSFKFYDVKDKKILTYINNKFLNFLHKYSPKFLIKNWRKLASGGAEKASGALGHGAVGTYPDRPYLHWSYKYELTKEKSMHNNPETFLEACKELHMFFSKFADKRNNNDKVNHVDFAKIEDKVKKLINMEAKKEDRVAAWKKAINSGDLFDNENIEHINYSPNTWEKMKKDFSKLNKSSDIITQDIYKYHQAAFYHRYYTLKQLLPKYKLVVY